MQIPAATAISFPSNIVGQSDSHSVLGKVNCWGSNEQGALGHRRSEHWLTHVGDQPNEMGKKLLTVPFGDESESLRAVQVVCRSAIWCAVNFC